KLYHTSSAAHAARSRGLLIPNSRRYTILVPIPAACRETSNGRRDGARQSRAEGPGGNAQASRWLPLQYGFAAWKGAPHRKCAYFRCAPDSKSPNRAKLFLKAVSEVMKGSEFRQR